jgi:hypothetical protein
MNFLDKLSKICHSGSGLKGENLKIAIKKICEDEISF